MLFRSDEINYSIQNYDIKKDGVGQMGVLKLTGPLKYSDIIDKHKHKFKIKYYKNLDKSRLIYNYTFKNIFDNISCNIYVMTKGKITSISIFVRHRGKGCPPLSPLSQRPYTAIMRHHKGGGPGDGTEQTTGTA